MSRRLKTLETWEQFFGASCGCFLLLFLLVAQGCRDVANAVRGLKQENRWVQPIHRRFESDAEREAATLKANLYYHFLLGAQARERGNSNLSVVAWDRVEKMDGSSPRIQVLLAQEKIKNGLLEEGVAHARKALEINPQSRDAKMLLGNLQATAKQFNEAYEIFKDLHDLDPKDEEILLYLALIEIEQKKMDDAHRRLSRFVKANPDSALAFFYLGRIEQERGNRKAAVEALKAAIDIRPGFVQAGTFLGFLYEELNDSDQALETYEWLAQETDDALFHKKLGQIYLEKNDFTNALKAFQNVERVEPNKAENLMRLGLLQLELKNGTLALAEFKKLERASPKSENLPFYFGAAHELNKEWALALDAYAGVATESQVHLEAFRRRVQIAARLHGKAEAWELLQKSRAAFTLPDGQVSEDWIEVAAKHLEENESSERANDFLQGFIEERAFSERLVYARGALLERMGRSNDAVIEMQKILDRNPDHAGALNFVGYTWADQGIRLVEAERYIRRALQIRPGDPYITDSLGWVYFRKGRVEKALELILEAFAKAPDEPEIAEHLGEILARLGRLGDAIKAYELARELQPENSELQKRLEERIQTLRLQVSANCKDQAKDNKIFEACQRTPATETKR